MRATRRLFAVVALAALARAALAQALGATASPDLPAALLGTYAETSNGCVNTAVAVQVTPRSVVTMSVSGDNSLMRVVTTQALGDWTVAVGGGDDMPRVLLRPAGVNADAGIDRLVPDPKLRDDQLPGPQAPVHLRRCDELPPLLAILHGEGLAALRALETMEPLCATGLQKACMEAFMSYTDLNKDGRLNAAELARMARGAAWFAQMTSGATTGELEAGLAGSLVGGLAVGETLVHSYDYDAQGSITPQQLMHDRMSIALQPQPRTSAAFPVEIGPVGVQLGPLMSLLHLLE
jgi:hypothetical protein